ncbi:MAG: hypothetical protein U0990_02935 [Candidatus Nanopelagicales bacterium]|nr:hypothetical protein [Candidatus Nanopelagicales bacterium]
MIWKRVAVGFMAAWALSVVAVAGLPSQATAEPRYGIGGSSSFPASTVFSIQPGAELPPVQFLRIQNTGTGKATVEFESKVPDGITVVPDSPTADLAPMQQHDFHFAIKVEEFVPKGEYEILVEGKQTNVPHKQGKLVYKPAFAVVFKVVVPGEAGSVKVQALSSADDSAVSGGLSIAMPGKPTPITVRETVGSTLEATLAPGDYFAVFNIPKLVNVREPFHLDANEDKTVVIKVDTVSFLVAAANKKMEEDKIVTVDLLGAVKNNVRPIEGPVTADVRVMRDGQEIDKVLLQQFPKLPTGISELRQSYRPDDGFIPGEYEFVFQLVTPDFTITAAQNPKFTVSGRSGMLWGVAAAVLVAAVALGLFLLRLWIRTPKP